MTFVVIRLCFICWVSNIPNYMMQPCKPTYKAHDVGGAYQWELTEARQRKQRGGALLLALCSFYNSPQVHGGWLPHGCPQCSVTSRNLMCVRLHQGPLAASVWLGAVWCCVTFTGSAVSPGVTGCSPGSYVGYWREDWITVSLLGVLDACVRLDCWEYVYDRLCIWMKILFNANQWRYFNISSATTTKPSPMSKLTFLQSMSNIFWYTNVRKDIGGFIRRCYGCLRLGLLVVFDHLHHPSV